MPISNADESKHIQIRQTLGRAFAAQEDKMVSSHIPIYDCSKNFENPNLSKLHQVEVERIHREHQAINQSIQNLKRQLLGKRKPEESGLLTVIDLENANLQKASAASDMNNQVDGGFNFSVPLNNLLNQASVTTSFGAQNQGSLLAQAFQNSQFNKQAFFPTNQDVQTQSIQTNQLMAQSGISGLLQHQKAMGPSPLEPTIQELKLQILNRRLATAQNGLQFNQQEEIPQIHQQKQGYAQQQNQIAPIGINNSNSISAQLSFNQGVKIASFTPEVHSPKPLEATSPLLASPNAIIQRISEAKVETIKQEILNVLPLAMQTDANFFNQLQSSQLNRLLLDYFVHSELSKKNAAEQPICDSPKTEGSTNENILTCAHSRKGSDKEFAPQSSPLQQLQTCQEDAEEFENYQNSNELSCEEDEEGCGRQKSDKVMLITRCPHTNRKHYAKNMCSSCYRKYGRSQNASRCPHPDRMLYSMGMCQTCYLADYHKRRIRSTGAQGGAAEERSAVANLIQTTNQSAN